MSHRVIQNLLGLDGAADLLAYAIANEESFVPTGVGTENEPVARMRASRRLTDLGPYLALVEQCVWPLVPGLIADLQLTRFRATELEIELVAHENGAFYKRHIDLFTDSARLAGDRLVSLVIYLNEQPKRFEGGELRLYPQINPAGMSDQGAIDIVPEHGLAVAFSSWMPHEVRPVACPSGEFRHARFAINCWVLRTHDTGGTPNTLHEGPAR